jgi:hypothetical protein
MILGLGLSHFAWLTNRRAKVTGRAFSFTLIHTAASARWGRVLTILGTVSTVSP